MKHNVFSRDQNQKPARASGQTAAANWNHDGIDFAPSADEVARKVYLSQGHLGSLPGHEVADWLEAETQLLAERTLTRVHALYNRRQPTCPRQPTVKESIHADLHP